MTELWAAISIKTAIFARMRILYFFYLQNLTGKKVSNIKEVISLLQKTICLCSLYPYILSNSFFPFSMESLNVDVTA